MATMEKSLCIGLVVIACVLLTFLLLKSYQMKSPQRENYTGPPPPTDFKVTQSNPLNLETAVLSWSGTSHNIQYAVVYGNNQSVISNGLGTMAYVTPSSSERNVSLTMEEIFDSEQLTYIGNEDGYVAVMPAIGNVGYPQGISPMKAVTGNGCTSPSGSPQTCTTGENCTASLNPCLPTCTCPEGEVCTNGACAPITCNPACTSPIETCVNGTCSPVTPTTPSAALSTPTTLHNYSVPSQLNPPGIYYVAYSLTNPSDTSLASEIGPYVELNAEVPFNGLTITIPSAAVGWNMNVYMTDPLDTANGWWMVNTIPSTITASSSGEETFVYGLW